jgi:hypothetical protein
MRLRFPYSAGIAAAALAALAAGGCSPGSGAFTLPDDPLVGRPAPPFVFHNVHQRPFPSLNFAGKTLVLIFVRAGQPEVQSLLLEMERMHREPDFTAVQFVAIAPEQDPITQPFWIGLRNTLPLALDYTDTAGRYGAGSLPMIVVRDFRENIRLRLDGFTGKDFSPKIAAVRKTVRESENFRTQPSSASPSRTP